MVKAMLNAKYGDLISVVNLSSNTGLEVDISLKYDGKTVFDAETVDLLDEAYYNYIIRDPRDGNIYAISGFDLDFDFEKII